MPRSFCSSFLLSVSLFLTGLCMQPPPLPVSMGLPGESAESGLPVPVAQSGRCMRCCRCGCHPCRLVWCSLHDLCSGEKTPRCFSGCGCCPPRIFCCGRDDGTHVEPGMTLVQCRPCEGTCCQEPESQTPTCRMGVYRDPVRLGCRWSNMWCLCLTCPCLCSCSPCLVGDRPENCFCTCKDCGKSCALVTAPMWAPPCATVQACYVVARGACCPDALPGCLRGHEAGCDQACASMWMDTKASCCPCPCLDARDDLTLYGLPYIFCCCAHHACLLEERGQRAPSGCL